MRSTLVALGAFALIAVPPAVLNAQTSDGTPVASVTGKGSQRTGPNSQLTGEDLFDIAYATDPQISPDGSTIIYTRRQSDIMTDRVVNSLWSIDVASGEERPFAGNEGAAFGARWSPDGSRVAYVSTQNGGAQLWVKWMDSGEAVKLTGLPNSPMNITWSPDGTQIAYVMMVDDNAPSLGSAPSNRPEGATWADALQITDLVNFRADGAGEIKPGFQKIFVIPATGGAPRQLTFGPNHDGGPLSWSADEARVFFSSNRNPNWQTDPVEADIWSVDTRSLGLVQLTTRDGPDSGAQVSPDGSMIAYVGFDDEGRAYEQTEIYVMNADGSNSRLLTGDWDFSPDAMEWDANSRALYVQYDKRGETFVARMSLDGSVRDVVEGVSGGGLDRPYTGGSFSVADNGTVAFTGGTATRPPEVKVTQRGNARYLTRLNASLLTTKRLGEVRAITTPSSHDGQEVQGWLTLPPGYTEGTRVPLILEIHGGPFAAYGPHFSTDNQLYAASGYAVLSANPRGSTSYGEGFAQEIDKAYPGQDFDDLISIVDRAIELGIADPDKLFVTGGSGGGVLTSWIVGKTNRFKAAATQKPVINWTTQALTADGTGYFGLYWVGSRPWENPQKFWDQSPLSLIGNVQTPTLVVVGGEDYRTPVSEAVQYYSALQLAGVPTTLIRVPGASHAITARPSQSAAKASAILAWFARYAEGWEPGEPAE
ncbi:peptidase S9 family protein [Erythrobacter sp. KY5]|uniref:S9 family peptidase n=1 Tax=Erythrobacter sp. KY5 TaxID=2011159 RepID=UPI000DBF1084|nr:S9 family peptidase [Erythrobacter sp. KY5]AWW74823.1 peptidase S9 family protein [Erythrobacter sp. KY5]